MENIIQTNKEDYNDSQATKNLSFFAVINDLLADLPERSREIVKKRFGLKQEKPQTLEKIGNDYGITRERVRQIVSDALKRVSQKRGEFGFIKAEDRIVFTIEANSGIIKESEIIEKLGRSDWREANALNLLRLCSGRIIATEEDGINLTWAENNRAIEKVRETLSAAREILKKEGRLFTDKEMTAKLLSVKRDFSKDEALDYLGVLSGIEKNKFGKWGMSDWAQISPKGTRERIYAILKEKGRPLHFTEIAKFIDKYGLSKKKAHVQTVHNELIKNNLFVLIGRGIYALKEWGYSQGTIRDVLEEILKRSGKALSRDEILKEVSKVRQVKKATVLINLSNNKFFIKQNNAYLIKKS